MFQEDLKTGLHGEALAIQALTDCYEGCTIQHIVGKPAKGTHPADIIVTKADGTVLKYDVKHDKRSATTGNIAFEKRALLESIKEGTDGYIEIYYDVSGKCYVRLIDITNLYETLKQLVSEKKAKLLAGGDKLPGGLPNVNAIIPVSIFNDPACPIKSELIAIL